MRLTSPEVKSLLERGQRQSAGVQQVTFSARTLPNANLGLYEKHLGRESRRAITHSDAVSKLAVAVPKRLLKRAVDRNRAKRVLREAFRHHAARAINISILITLTQAPKSNILPRRRFMAMLSLSADALLKKVVAKQESFFPDKTTSLGLNKQQISAVEQTAKRSNQTGEQ